MQVDNMTAMSDPSAVQGQKAVQAGGRSSNFQMCTTCWPAISCMTRSWSIIPNVGTGPREGRDRPALHEMSVLPRRVTCSSTSLQVASIHSYALYCGNALVHCRETAQQCRGCCQWSQIRGCMPCMVESGLPRERATDLRIIRQTALTRVDRIRDRQQQSKRTTGFVCFTF